MGSNLSLTQCCAVAARKNGVAPISSFEDGSKQAKVYAVNWQPSLNESLDAAPWYFCLETEALGNITSTHPPADPQYSHTFQLPALYRRKHKVLTSSGQELLSGWAIEGGKLYSCRPGIVLKYFRDFGPDDFPTFPSWFATLFIAALAHASESAILNRPANIASLWNEFQVAYRQALRINSQESPGATQPVSNWHRVRQF